MLGINDKRTPVSGIFAKQMKDALERARKGQFTASEIEARQRMMEASKKYNVVWL